MNGFILVIHSGPRQGLLQFGKHFMGKPAAGKSPGYCGDVRAKAGPAETRLITPSVMTKVATAVS
jgi:hypothetical protein